MSDKNKNKNLNNPGDAERSSFQEDEPSAADMVWELSGSADPAGIHGKVTQEETEEALEEIHARLDFQKPSGKIAGSIQKYSRILVAALALIIFGTVLLFMPQSVTAPYGEMAEVELPDGSLVELNSGTNIQFNRLFGYTNRTITLNGEAHFEVRPGDDSFEVKANGTVISVLGTEFTIRSWASDPELLTEVAVTSGHVEFFPEGYADSRVNLTGGLVSRWNPELTTPSEPEETDLEQMTGWRDRMFIFQEQPLHRIFSDIERRFDVRIELERPGISNDRLTGYYREAMSAESLLEDICTVAGLNYAETANGFRIY